MLDNTVQSKRRENVTKRFFHNYFDLCRTKNMHPLAEIKSKSVNMIALDFKADHVNFNDWMNILKCLDEDESLQVISIRLRKSAPSCAESVDTLKKASLVRKYPVVLTKYIFSMLIDIVARLLERSTQLRVLLLEGLPITPLYCYRLTKSLAANKSLQVLSLARSPMEDEGCKQVCSVLNHLMNIDSVNLSGCKMTTNGAESVAKLVKMQRISRFSDSWEQSLRYRDVKSLDQIGIRHIILNNNPQLRDEGCELITNELIEDEWVQTIEMENCGLTVNGANAVVSCLKINSNLRTFKVHRNADIPSYILERINNQLGVNPDDLNSGCMIVPATSSVVLSERIAQLEMQLTTEKFRCKELEKLNDKLTMQIRECHKPQNMVEGPSIPEGYTLINDESLHGLLTECQSLRCFAAMAQQECEAIATPPPPQPSPPRKQRKRVGRKQKSRNIAKTRSESQAADTITIRAKPCTMSDSALQTSQRSHVSADINVDNHMNMNNVNVRHHYGDDSVDSTVREASQEFSAAEAMRILIKNKTEKPDFEPKPRTLEHLEAGDYANNRALTQRTYFTAFEYPDDIGDSIRDFDLRGTHN